MAINLSYGFEFKDLYSTAGLAKIHAEFLKSNPPEDLLERAKAVEDFVAELFNIRSEVAALKAQHDELMPIFKAKKLFVQRQLKKYLSYDNVNPELVSESTELEIAEKILKAMDKEDTDFLTATAHFLNDNAADFPVLMKLPKRLDYENLVCKDHIQQRERNGFSLTDDGGSLERALDQANYCIYCHPRDKDSCSKGMWEEQKSLPLSRGEVGGGQRLYPKENVELARKLRANQTDAEKLIWELLRNKQLDAKFRRQQPIGKYIVDFVCLERKLIIELDGSQHLDSKSDEIRDKFLEEKGFQVLRFWNSLVLQETESVVEKIWNSLHHPHPNPLPSREMELRTPKISETDVPLAGCPLEEKISEMNMLKAEGFSIAALAVVTLDNPMCAATGHRICNDCMKSCIYQKQEPVDIPQVESRNLRDVLSLPFGFEIYSLLTRWNPLNAERPIPKEDTGKKVLVVGLGPAGFTLAHHLLNDGHEVFAIDGLKIEPLNIPFEPIKNWADYQEDLAKRKPQGFGGVAEYGITVRWDKNFLTIIRLLIERRKNFASQGGCRFGSNITKTQAIEMGFDHIAMCAGAGKPNVVNMKNAMARGVRTASDFLMSLQSGGAFREESLTNLTVRAPIVVIGGGLTAIDTCTEAKAYYEVQKHKFKERYEFLCKHRGKENVHARWNEEEKIIAAELLDHPPPTPPPNGGRQKTPSPLRGEGWGEGKNDDTHQQPTSTIIYRKKLQDSPAYRLNHEEVEKAFEEGIGFIERSTPLEVVLDKFGHAEAIRINRGGEEITIPARTILVAAGTQPNAVLASEQDGIETDGKYFQMLDENGNLAKPTGHCKPHTAHVLMQDDMSFFGDLHPDFAGNVVKAMASAKRGYPIISKLLNDAKSADRASLEPASIYAPEGERGSRQKIPLELNQIKSQLKAEVHQVNRLAPRIVEVVVKAPLAAKNFRPGQFYKLQNFESNNSLAAEPMAMTGAWTDVEKGLLGMIVLEMGGSSDLCVHFNNGEELVLMGPTGTPTEIPKNEKVVLCGGGLGNAVLFSIGKAMRENGCHVTYFAGYKKADDRYKIADIEAAADIIIWACDSEELSKTREQDHSFKGNMVEAMVEYGNLTKAANRLIVIGSDRMMAAVAYERHHKLKEFLPSCDIAIGSINSPMQCMMKEICAQCLQRHVDPKTGEESYVYSCFNQDQCLDTVDFDHLSARLKQNELQEDLTSQWIDLQLREKKLRKNVA